MEDYEDEIANSWPMKLFAIVMATPLMAYGIWCLYHGRAYLIGFYPGVSSYRGMAADFIAWSIIDLASLAFIAQIPFKNRKLQKRVLATLFLLVFVLGGIGSFY